MSSHLWSLHGRTYRYQQSLHQLPGYQHRIRHRIPGCLHPGELAIYWSAAFWTIGRTVVEPLILMVCFWPVETGAVVITAAGVVDAGACVVATTVGDAVGTLQVVFVPFPVQPASKRQHEYCDDAQGDEYMRTLFFFHGVLP